MRDSPLDHRQAVDTAMPRPRSGWRLGSLLIAAFLLVAGALPAHAQEGTIAGSVIDESSLEPLSGAQVVIEGTGQGTLTDAAGRFQFVGLTGEQVTLQVLLIGYQPVTETVSVGTTGLEITMSEQAVELDEIVVTGTAGGTQKRALGTVLADIDAAEVVETQPVNNVQDLINGRAPGVVILPGTGQVGSGGRIRIRGLSSLSLSQEPLLVVDGVRVNNAQGVGPITQGFGSAVISRINDFDPEDIQSIEIIKGPAAATLYGTEASNGVIQIITKKGVAGTPRFNLSIKQGANWFANPEGRLYTNWGPDLRTCDLDEEGEPIISTATCDIVTIDMYELEASGANRENGQGRELFQTGHQQKYDLSVSGGSQAVRYYVGGSWEDNEGIEPNNALEQFSLRGNIAASPTDRVDVSASLGYVRGTTDLSWESGAGGISWSTYYATPENLYNPDGSFSVHRGFFSATPEVYYQFADWQDLARFTGSVQVDHRPIEWFSHRLTFGTDQTETEDVELVERNDFVATFFPGEALGYRAQDNTNTIFNTVDYSGTLNFDIQEGVSSSTSVGAQYYSKYSEFVSAFGEGFPAPGVRAIDAAAINEASHNYFENSTIGVYAQEQIAFNNRLFLTGAVRADDNSAFGENFDLVYYPKVSASWVISEENFWSLPQVNTLKLRAAYGESGQQPDVFTALRAFTPVTGPDDQPTVTPGQIGNPDLGPERGREVEVGFDAGLFDDRLGLNFTFYNTVTSDAILLRQVAPSTGFSGVQYINAGEIRNRGIELLATARPVVTSNFEWDVALNFAQNDNEITDLGIPDLEFVPVATFQEHREGYPVSSWFERKIVSAELDADGNPINMMCDDGSGGTVSCDEAPRVFLGRPTPKVEGSFNTNVTFRQNFRLGVMFDFKTGYHKLDGDRRVRCWFFNLCHQNWFPAEHDPVLVAGAVEGFANDILFPADFLKFREISASYNVPDRLAEQFGASRATLTVAARNLYTWTEYPGLEPEAAFISTGSRGGQALWEQNVIPQLAQFMVGIDLTF